MAFLIGLDIGGTFTDAAAIDSESGVEYTAKAKTTPNDLLEGLEAALEELASNIGLSLNQLLQQAEKFAHGTTQTSNVMFTWTGARTGLLTTKGFADELLIMRARGRVAGVSLAQRRHFRTTEKPPQVIPRSLIEEVTERIDHHGKAVVELTREEAVRAVDALLARGVEAVAISLLWSQENPAHEQLLEEVLRERAPDIYVSSSHKIAPVLGEYERTATTAVNAYVGPTVVNYLRELDQRLRALGLRAPLLIVQADGGVVEAAQAVPVRTIESGPAAAMVAVREIATKIGRRNVIATDVGGTTFKVGLLADGEWGFAPETIIQQYVLLTPMVDLVSIGSGGGSIAWVDDHRLRVGPQSAGAQPGPASYGWGGTEPTVTDADLVLGFLNPDRFLGGRIRLSVEAAREAIAERIAADLFEGDVIRAAAGIRSVVDAQMSGLIRRVTIERGHDPREFVLVAYGGAGPVHAASYARGLEINEVIIPQGATAYSAYGAATSDIQHFLQRSLSPTLAADPAAIEEAYEGLSKQAGALLEQQGIAPDRVRVSRWADMRYERQLHDVRVPVPDVSRSQLLSTMRADFEERYELLYGTGAVLARADVQLLRIGIIAVGIVSKPAVEAAPLSQADPTPADLGSRRVFWPELGDWLPTQVYEGERLEPGSQLAGPALIEFWGTTIAVPDDAKAKIDPFGNTVITL